MKNLYNFLIVFGLIALPSILMAQVTVGNTGILTIPKSGQALIVNGGEAIWANSAYYSWGYGKSWNYFADEVLIGNGGGAPYTPSTAVGLTISNNRDIRLEGTGGKYLYFYEGSVAKGYVGHSGNHLILQNDETNGMVEIDGQTEVDLRINNNSALNINSSGLVTIDRTGEAIRLNGSSSYMTFYNGATYNGYLWHNNTNMYLNNNNAAGSMYFGTGASGVDMTINTAGNVGIGTTAPSERLHVVAPSGSTTADIRLEASASKYLRFYEGATQKMVLGHSGTHSYLYNYETGGNMYLGTAGGADLTIDATGNVGIGVTNPSSKLEMVGNADIGSNIYLGKNAGTDDAFMRIGHDRTANGNAFFTLVGDASAYPGYGLRFLRMPTGESRIEHRGTQPMVFNAPDAGGHYSFKIGGAAKVEFLGNACRPGIDGGINLGQNGNRWAAVYAVNGTIQTSDKRLKKNIDELDYGLAEIMRLKPVSYDWKDENALLGKKIGLIAQEVQEVISEVVYDKELQLIDNEDGSQSYRTIDAQNIGMNYSELIPVLINGIQEQQAQIIAKDEKIIASNEKIAALESQLNVMQDAIKQIQAEMSIKTIETNTSQKNVVLEGANKVATLEQNQPNPFSENTTINYFIPEGTSGAKMSIFSVEGKLLKSVEIDAAGSGQINLKANSLPAGTYRYQLTTDTGIIGGKSMVLIK